jgi:hypothetical protein
MKLLSIDVGIKNLSFCLFDTQVTSDPSELKILKWDNIDLSESVKLTCMESDAKGLCNKPAKFCKNGNCYCLKHSKKQMYLQPITELKSSNLNKQKINDLQILANKYKINYEPTAKKATIVQLLTQFKETYCYDVVEKTNATKVDLVTIGKNIQHKLDIIFSEHFSTLDTIIIENQIGPIANKMKTIQGMISQYFIMKNNDIQIEFISASNKLKDFIPKSKDEDNKEQDKKKKMDYKDRKKLGIETCLQMVNTNKHFEEWSDFLSKHTKKDDLSDCFLQGMWFIKYKT